MNSAQISAALTTHLPSVIISVNPKGVRELANHAGRPYASRVDEIIAAFSEPKVANQDAPLRDFTFSHAKRQVTVYFARVRGFGSADIPKTRALAISVDAEVAEAPDRLLAEYVESLKSAIMARGEDADEVLQKLTGTSIRWDASA